MSVAVWTRTRGDWLLFLFLLSRLLKEFFTQFMHSYGNMVIEPRVKPIRRILLRLQHLQIARRLYEIPGNVNFCCLSLQTPYILALLGLLQALLWSTLSCHRNTVWLFLHKNICQQEYEANKCEQQINIFPIQNIVSKMFFVLIFGSKKLISSQWR